MPYGFVNDMPLVFTQPEARRQLFADGAGVRSVALTGDITGRHDLTAQPRLDEHGGNPPRGLGLARLQLGVAVKFGEAPVDSVSDRREREREPCPCAGSRCRGMNRPRVPVEPKGNLMRGILSRHATAALAVVLGISAAHADEAGADPTEAVRCAEIRFAQSVERGDRAAFRSSLDPDARFIGSTVQRGAEEIAGAWSIFFDEGGPRIRWRPQQVEVLAAGDLALTRGPFRLESRAPDGTETVGWGTFTSIWRKADDGHWRIVFDSGSAPDEDPPAEVRALLGSADPAADCD